MASLSFMEMALGMSSVPARVKDIAGTMLRMWLATQVCISVGEEGAVVVGLGASAEVQKEPFETVLAASLESTLHQVPMGLEEDRGDVVVGVRPSGREKETTGEELEGHGMVEKGIERSCQTSFWAAS